ncbi:hypothetical protein TKK_0016023 [Trichogramma kaykai]
MNPVRRKNYPQDNVNLPVEIVKKGSTIAEASAEHGGVAELGRERDHQSPCRTALDDDFCGVGIGIVEPPAARSLERRSSRSIFGQWLAGQQQHRRGHQQQRQQDLASSLVASPAQPIVSTYLSLLQARQIDRDNPKYYGVNCKAIKPYYYWRLISCSLPF